jgi:NurA-like 5'-3' nuclease
MKSPLLILVFAIFLISSCSPQLNYLGNRYTPTDKVILYFDAKEVAQDYSVMGLLNFKVSNSIFNSEENYTTTLITDKAKEVGADGVIVTKFSNETYQEVDEHIMTKKISTNEVENVIVEAKFIKFKN